MNAATNRITRHGAYGVILQGSQVLLTQKKSGPYRGLWGLPGGAIEFGETPEETLRRELLEETALQVDQLALLCTATSRGTYENEGKSFDFHHIGIIYKVGEITPLPHLVPEEEGRWIELSHLDANELTPFARHVLREFSHPLTINHSF